MEGQVSKQSSEQIHDEHGQERHISHTLHLSTRTTVEKNNTTLWDYAKALSIPRYLNVWV